MINAPCYNCIKRRLGCHGNCAEYDKYRKAKWKENHKRQIDSKADGLLIENYINRRNRAAHPMPNRSGRYQGY